jgi:meiosis-specific APC/C activator protein AMA1
VSVGTVWAVGGLAPVGTGVPSGRGGLLVSGTNAPLYTTSFSVARPKAKEDLEKHEGRLAEALELDRVSRVLEFRDPLTTPLGTLGITKSAKTAHSRTVWRGTEWVLGGPEYSKQPIWLH